MKKRTIGATRPISVIVTTALALFNLGVFGILLLSGNQVSQLIRENFEVQIFLNKTVDASGVEALKAKLTEKPYLAHNRKNAIQFVSKEEAGEKFRTQTGENFAEFLGENPLRDAFSIKISDEYLDNAKLKEIQKELTALPEVFEVVYVESLAGTIQENLARISILFISISLLLLITVIWLIRNTIRLSIYSSRFLIRSMELVGARPGFIQGPFIKNLAIQGFWSGLVAVALLQTGIWVGTQYYPPFSELMIDHQIWMLGAGLLVFGILLNASCAYLSVRRYLGKGLEFMYSE